MLDLPSTKHQSELEKSWWSFSTLRTGVFLRSWKTLKPELTECQYKDVSSSNIVFLLDTEKLQITSCLQAQYIIAISCCDWQKLTSLYFISGSCFCACNNTVPNRSFLEAKMETRDPNCPLYTSITVFRPPSPDWSCAPCSCAERFITGGTLNFSWTHKVVCFCLIILACWICHFIKT